MAQQLTPIPGATPTYDEDGNERVVVATCHTCGRSWNDAAISSFTPAPSARCPFEYEHTTPADRHDFLTADLGLGRSDTEPDTGAWFDRVAAYEAYIEDPAPWHECTRDNPEGDPLMAMVLAEGPWWVEPSVYHFRVTVQAPSAEHALAVMGARIDYDEEVPGPDGRPFDYSISYSADHATA